METVNAIQELLTEGEDKLTYLRSEVEKRKSLLQSERSDLNVQGVSILKEIYAKENSNDHSSVNASSRELLPRNKRRNLLQKRGNGYKIGGIARE